MTNKLFVFLILSLMTMSPLFTGSILESDSTDALTLHDSKIESDIGSVPVDYYKENPLVDLSSGTTLSSMDYSNIAKQLSERYPAIISHNVIGYSHDEKEIFSIIMTKDVDESMLRDDFNLYRMHYYIDAGVHERETVNPAILMKQIEDYANDYYLDSNIPDFSLEEILSRSVLHFIPLVNPDGHDLSKFGPYTVNTNFANDLLSEVDDMNYSQWKANIAGVDLNKNFPDFYFNKISGELIENLA